MIALPLAKLHAAPVACARVALLVAAIVLALGLLLLPVVLLHKHYDDAIASLTDRLERYRRVAAQAPEYRTRSTRCGRRTAAGSS